MLKFIENYNHFDIYQQKHNEKFVIFMDTVDGDLPVSNEIDTLELTKSFINSLGCQKR